MVMLASSSPFFLLAEPMGSAGAVHRVGDAVFGAGALPLSAAAARVTRATAAAHNERASSV